MSCSASVWGILPCLLHPVLSCLQLSPGGSLFSEKETGRGTEQVQRARKGTRKGNCGRNVLAREECNFNFFLKKGQK